MWSQRGSAGQVRLTGPLVTTSKLPAYFLVLPVRTAVTVITGLYSSILMMEAVGSTETLLFTLSAKFCDKYFAS
jgi:hypothetical protein